MYNMILMILNVLLPLFTLMMKLCLIKLKSFIIIEKKKDIFNILFENICKSFKLILFNI